MIIFRSSSNVIVSFNEMIQAWITAERLNKRLLIVSDDIPHLNPYFNYEKYPIKNSPEFIEYKNLMFPEETHKDLLKYYYIRFFLEIIRYKPKPKYNTKYIVFWGDKAISEQQKILDKYRYYNKKVLRFTDEDAFENWSNFVMLHSSDIIVSENSEFIDIVIQTCFNTTWIKL